MATASGKPPNLLLAQLPPAEFDRLKPHLTTVTVPLRGVYHEAGEPLTHVFFPNVGVASIISGMTDGTEVETTTVGREGMIGIEAAFGGNPVTVCRCVQQVGPAILERISVDAFRSELLRGEALQELVGRFNRVLLATALQAAACNALHDLASRCARWLLMAHDRVEQQPFQLSHEYLALMLGVQRPSVTVAAGALQQAGIIKYRHGNVTVLDRQRLEEAACECYQVLRQQFGRAGLQYPSAPQSAQQGTEEPAPMK